MTWLPCPHADFVVGDAIRLDGQDPSLDRWTLTGRVRRRTPSGSLLVEWSGLTGDGTPPFPLWQPCAVRPAVLAPGRVYRHSVHGPLDRTDAAGETMLRSMVAGADVDRVAACVVPGGGTVGEREARRVVDGEVLPHEWLLRQLDGRMTGAQAEAYEAVVQVRRTATKAREVVVPDGAVADVDEDLAMIDDAMPGARVADVRLGPRKVAQAVEAAVG